MSNKRTRAAARVTISVEVGLDSGWGKDCTIGQVYDQAKDEALHRVRSALGGKGPNGETGSMRIVGEPKVEYILAEDKP